jgi:Rhodopirellula transposase DDE domain
VLGNLKNPGKTYRRKGRPVEVDVHDFPDKKLGKAIPYGVYDIRVRPANPRGRIPDASGGRRRCTRYALAGRGSPSETGATDRGAGSRCFRAGGSFRQPRCLPAVR